MLSLEIIGFQDSCNYQGHFQNFARKRANCFCQLLKGVWDPETAKSHSSPGKRDPGLFGLNNSGQCLLVSCLLAEDKPIDTGHYCNLLFTATVSNPPTPTSLLLARAQAPALSPSQANICKCRTLGSPSLHFFRESNNHPSKPQVFMGRKERASCLRGKLPKAANQEMSSFLDLSPSPSHLVTQSQGGLPLRILTGRGTKFGRVLLALSLDGRGGGQPFSADRDPHQTEELQTCLSHPMHRRCLAWLQTPKRNHFIGDQKGDTDDNNNNKNETI